jgi:hypothetical protein
MPGYRFGKHPPKHDYRTLRFKNYLMPGVAAPPAQFNVLERVFDTLHDSDPSKLFPMDGNDRYGDCTIAALAHAITVFRALGERQSRIMAQQAVLKLYMKLTGGVDSGLNELDVMNYWRKTATATRSLLSRRSTRRTTRTYSRRSRCSAASIWASSASRTASRSFRPKNPGRRVR